MLGRSAQELGELGTSRPVEKGSLVVKTHLRQVVNVGNKKTILDFPKNELFDYFNNLLQTNADKSNVFGDSEEGDQYQTTIDDLTLSQIDSVLNSTINIQEVRNMVSNLKNNKAPGLDMISAELLENLDDRLYQVFVHLFNKILKNGNFPEE